MPDLPKKEKLKKAEIKLKSAICLHCNAENSYDPEITLKFTCNHCGWFNDLDFDELEEVPLRILPVDFSEKWRDEYQFKEDLHVAYVPFTAEDLKNLPTEQKDQFLKIWDKMELDDIDCQLIKNVRHGGPIGDIPVITLQNQNLVTSTRGTGLRVRSAYIQDGVLKCNQIYALTLIDETTKNETPMGRLELKGYPEAAPTQYQFRLPKTLNETHTFTVKLYQ